MIFVGCCWYENKDLRNSYCSSGVNDYRNNWLSSFSSTVYKNGPWQQRGETEQQVEAAEQAELLEMADMAEAVLFMIVEEMAVV